MAGIGNMVDSMCDEIHELKEKIDTLKAENKKLRKDAKELVNTTYRVIDNIPQTKASKEWPFAGFVKSVKYHLKKIDYIYNENEDKEHDYTYLEEINL